MNLTDLAQAHQFLRSPWPDLLAYLVDPDGTEERIDYGEIKASFRREYPTAPGWAWAIWRDGLRFEPEGTWGGWNCRPRLCIPWADLRALIDSHPAQVARIRALAEGRGTPWGIGWRWFSMPLIFRHGMHPSYYEGEREDGYYSTGPDFPTKPDGYAERLHAWLLAWQIVDDLAGEPADLIEWAAMLA